MTRRTRCSWSCASSSSRTPPTPEVKVERKPGVSKSKKGAGGTESSAGGEGAAPAGPFIYQSISVFKNLFTPINTATPDKDIKNQQIKSGTLSMQSRQFTQLEINPVESIDILSRGDYGVAELFEPTGKKLVQVQGAPPPEGGDPWAWGTLN